MGWELDEEHDAVPRHVPRLHRSRGAPARRAGRGRRARSRTSCGSRWARPDCWGWSRPRSTAAAGGDALTVADPGRGAGQRERRHRGRPRWSARTWPARTSSGTAATAQRSAGSAPLAAGEAVAAIAVTEPRHGLRRRRHQPRTAPPHRRAAGCSTAARCSSPTPAWPTCSSSPPAPARAGHSGITLFLVERGTTGPVDGPPAGARWAGTPPTPARWCSTTCTVPRRRGARHREPRLPPDHGGLPARADRAGRHGPRARRGVPRPGARRTPASARRSAPRSTRLQTIRHRLARWRSSWMRPGWSPTRPRPGSTRAIPRRCRRWRGRSTSPRSPPTGSSTTPCSSSAAPGSSRRRRWRGTTATPASCASAAAPTRSSWRSSPRAWP